MTDLVDLGEGFFWQPFWLHSKAAELFRQALPQYAIASLQLSRGGLLKHGLIRRLQTTCFGATCRATIHAATEMHVDG